MSFQSQLDTLQASIENIASQLVTIQSYLTATGPNAVVILTDGSSWTVPAGVTVLLAVEAVGGGQADGGQGGGYAHLANYSVTPGATISYSIGLGGVGSTTGASNPGGDTWFDSTSILCAKGGGSSGSFAPNGGYHQTNHQGAAGPVWTLNQSKDADNGFGGRGGADASSTLQALPGGPGTEWGIGFGCGGGGGNGGGYNTPGGDGGLYGGAGGNADSGVLGGSGAQGILVITFARV